ncbi:hypothetical protein ACFPIJ_19135 [Dactylosporangium cerinum]|uniref:Uncharacterized protein n=1 Tax=Dactylosporangium cerinum TaxID=1434730 RepID=A0ABV9VXK7_9ACTN
MSADGASRIVPSSLIRSRSTGPSVFSSSKPAYTSGCSAGGTMRTRRIAVQAAGGSRKTISRS